MGQSDDVKNSKKEDQRRENIEFGSIQRERELQGVRERERDGCGVNIRRDRKIRGIGRICKAQREDLYRVE